VLWTLRIFVVDENPVVTRNLASALSSELDCDVQAFSSSAAALEASADTAPDAVIADLRLPQIDGLELLERLGQSDPHLVGLVSTRADDSVATAEALARVGPLRHVSKPFELADLLPRLQAFVERRRLALELARVQSELAQRDSLLRATHSELATATERLVAAEQLAAVGRVVTGIAHEIGSQLTLVGYAEAIKSRVTDPELVEFADILISAQKRLAAMVDEIRDFARGDSDDLSREPAEVSSVVEEALAILHYDRDVRARNIERDFRARPLAALDREKFSQVVINLISNAALATSTGDTIKLELWSEADKGYCILTVTDHGAGMPRHVLERLGEPFFTTRGDRGSGLGVGICMRICEEHGGSLAYCSEEGKGTIARVRLPLVPENSI
jgi:signal transduction histidine kinase